MSSFVCTFHPCKWQFRVVHNSFTTFQHFTFYFNFLIGIFSFPSVFYLPAFIILKIFSDALHSQIGLGRKFPLCILCSQNSVIVGAVVIELFYIVNNTKRDACVFAVYVLYKMNGLYGYTKCVSTTESVSRKNILCSVL